MLPIAHRQASGGFFQVRLEEVHVTLGRRQVRVPSHTLDHVDRNARAQPRGDGVMAEAIHGKPFDVVRLPGSLIRQQDSIVIHCSNVHDFRNPSARKSRQDNESRSNLGRDGSWG